MGQTARLRLIRDRFIAGHISWELCWYLDSVPPETPIRDVVDRCRVWESHTDPEIRRISKPSPDPIYLAYVVGDSDNVVENIQVAAVTKPKSTPDQVEDPLRRLPAGMASPAPVPAPGSDGGKIAAAPGGETQSRQPAPVIPPELVGLGNLLRSYLSGQQTSGQQTRQRRHWNGIVCFFHAESRVIVRLVAPLWMSRFCSCCRGGGLRRHRVVSL